MGDSTDVAKTFRDLVESADRKFARVRDVQPYGRRQHAYFHKVFKAYTKLWKFQQENRKKLVEAGLQRWEIGEIASRIGQLYFGQYMRTCQARFLFECYVFYEAILNRGYFEGTKGSPKDMNLLGLRYKELRFYARFLVVALLLNRLEMVHVLVDRFKAILDDCRATFPETNFKEWKQVVQEIARFLKVDVTLMNTRPLRYCALYDSHPTSQPYVARFHANRVLKFQDALLTSYHRNEVKFTEFTLNTFRMLQCLEWEPSGSFYQERLVESSDNGALNDRSGPSGLIDINLAVDMTDRTLPPNPKKTILYRPSTTQLLAAIAMVCEELPPDSIVLIYLSGSGKFGRTVASQTKASRTSMASLDMKFRTHEHEKSLPEVPNCDKGDSTDCSGNYLWLGPRGSAGSNMLYPGDIIPFTRKPLFLIIDSDNSHAFKVIHGEERGERAALLLSPSRPVFRNQSGADLTQNGSQFTFFLTAPLQAFCQLLGLSQCGESTDVYSKADNILCTAFSEWEEMLCTTTDLDLVWAQVLSDAFLRRLILRFIFCRSVLFLFCHSLDGNCDQCRPNCLPHLPESVSSNSEVVQSSVRQLANIFDVADCFNFKDK